MASNQAAARATPAAAVDQKKAVLAQLGEDNPLIETLLRDVVDKSPGVWARAHFRSHMCQSCQLARSSEEHVSLCRAEYPYFYSSSLPVAPHLHRRLRLRTLLA